MFTRTRTWGFDPLATKTSTDSEAEKWKLVTQTGCQSGKLISVLVTPNQLRYLNISNIGNIHCNRTGPLLNIMFVCEGWWTTNYQDPLNFTATVKLNAYACQLYFCQLSEVTFLLIFYQNWIDKVIQKVEEVSTLTHWYCHNHHGPTAHIIVVSSFISHHQHHQPGVWYLTLYQFFYWLHWYWEKFCLIIWFYYSSLVYSAASVTCMLAQWRLSRFTATKSRRD